MSATIAAGPAPQQGMIGKVMAALRTRPPKLLIQSSDERVPRKGPGNPLPFDNFSSLLPVFAFDAQTQLFLIKGAKEGELEGVGFTIEIAPELAPTAEWPSASPPSSKAIFLQAPECSSRFSGCPTSRR